jgi:polyphosphate kinase
MRRKQWILSVLLFSASLFFLLYSQDFFSRKFALRPQTVLPTNEGQSTTVVMLANEDYYPFLRQYLKKAQKRIVGTVYLIKTSTHRENEPSELVRELAAAKQRGVDVDLVFDLSSEDAEYNTANLEAAEQLKSAGIKVRLDHSRITTHSKTFVIDDRYCFVGSHNLTHSAMSMNQELSLFVDSPDLASKITEYIRQIPLSASK